LDGEPFIGHSFYRRFLERVRESLLAVTCFSIKPTKAQPYHTDDNLLTQGNLYLMELPKKKKSGENNIKVRGSKYFFSVFLPLVWLSSGANSGVFGEYCLSLYFRVRYEY